MSKFFKVGLALGGGGARGVAHLGVLSVLEREKIPFDLIVGTSFGAIVGAMYAINPNAHEVYDEILTYVEGPRFKKTTLNFLRESLQANKKASGLFSNLKSYVRQGIFMSMSISKGAFLSESDFLDVISGVVKEYSFEDTAIPFSCVATDLVKGEEVVLSNGSMLRPVSASCAIPGIFPVISCNDTQMIDGGWVNKVPVMPAFDQGADFVIAIDTSDNFEYEADFQSGLQVLTRSNDITRKILSEFQECFADFLIRPQIGHIHWTGFSKASECFEEGVKAGELIVEKLKSEILKKRVSSFLFMRKSKFKVAKNRFIYTRE